MDIEIIKKERKPAKMGLSCPRNATHIDVAAVSIAQGKIVIEAGFSRYSTEDKWYIDYQFTNKLPDFCHGEGSRSCLKRAAKGELHEAIEAKPFDHVDD